MVRQAHHDVKTRALRQEFSDLKKIHASPLWDVHTATDRKEKITWIIKLSANHTFEEEAKLLSPLSHPSWSRIIDWGKDSESGKYFLIREYKEGENLRKKGSLAPETLLEITVQLARILFYLHQQGLAYLDIKPENIVWDGHRACLIDSSLVSSFSYTMKKMPEGGTPAYMAPECFLGGALYPQADLYSLGVLLYELVTGIRPFAAKDLRTLVALHLFKTPPHPSVISADCPRHFGDLILRLLQKNPADRFEDGNDLIRSMNRLFEKEWPLEPEQTRLTAKETKRLREKNPLAFVDRTIAYLENLPDKSDEEMAELGSLFLLKDDAEGVERVAQTLSPQPAATLMARLFSKQGRFTKAWEILEKTGGEESDIPHKNEGPFQNIRGRILYYLGKRAEAKESFSRALKAFEREKDEEGIINALTNGGNAAIALGQMEEGGELYQQALVRAEKLGNPILEARCHANMGFLSLHENRYGWAFDSYKKAYEMNDLMGKREEKIQAGFNLGALYTFFGSWIKASEILAQCHVEATVLDNAYLKALCRLHQADLRLSQGAITEALPFFEGCFPLTKLSTNPTDLFHVYLTGSEVKFLMGQNDQAEKFLAQAEAELSQGNLSQFKKRLEWIHCLTARKTGKGESTSDPISLVRKLFGAKDQIYGVRALIWCLTQNDASCRKSAASLRHELVEKINPEIPPPFRESFANRFPSEEETMKVTPFEETATPKGAGLYEKIVSLNTALISELDLNRLLEKIMDALIEMTDAERGFILLAENGELKKVFTKNYEKGVVKTVETEISTTLSKQVFAQNRAVVTVDALTDDRFSHTESIHKLKLRSIICIPFSFRGEVLGVVYLDNRLKKSLFEEERIRLLEPFAQQIAIAIRNATVFKEKNQRIEHLSHELEQSQKEITLKYSYANLVGRHPKMIRLFQLLDKVTDATVPVLIHGESGVGKEMVAKAIHYNGKRAKGPFVSINCAAIPENLLEAELFGAAKGAYTGATEDRPGLFELAHGGTLFLDEIGDMPLTMQSKLLRVIQEGEVRPVGGKKSLKVDVRIVSASNKNLKELVTEKKFREDLFYRLYVAPITLPPLRERREDIPLLVDHFLDHYSKKNQTPKKKISKEAIRMFAGYSWPGNVRELENFIYQLCVFSENKVIEVADLRIKEEFFEKGPEARGHGLSQTIDSGKLSLSQATSEFEKSEIIRVLGLYNGHITKAATHLKMVRPQLSRLIKNYGIKAKA